ncbi:MAG: transglutaminaseTgpA domain-containing protein [Sulfurovum sp.]
MRYLRNWLSTKPSPLKVLDIAYITLLLPLVFFIKLPILFFLLLVLILLLAGKKPTTFTLITVAITGSIAIFFSLYGSFNVAGLSRLKLFVELLLYILLMAISLQRLTREINFYLKISPMLLLATSLFFFHSIPMLIYIVFEIFLLTTMLVWQVIQSTLYTSLRISSALYIASLPIVILLFIFFPRISFEHAKYGFKGEVIHRSGHDGLMYLDKNALLVPSQRIVMEVGFKEEIPSSDQLYFRGSVLYKKIDNIWKPLKASQASSRPDFSRGKLTAYKVTLYPTNKRWIYLLDTPVSLPDKATLDFHFESKMPEPVTKTFLYQAGSVLQSSYRSLLPDTLKKIALDYDPESDPQTQALAQKIKSEFTLPKQRVEAIQSFFRQQQLTYTLQPKPFDLNNSTDSFLFAAKEGYCVHFAAAFTTLARMAGIPSRIVTGYKPDGSDSIENYLIIRERDAHAWVEVYLDGYWHRIESTAFASAIIGDPDRESNLETLQNQKSSWERVNLYLHYIKYQIDTWILEYSSLSQKKLFSYLKTDTLFLAKFIASFILLLALLILILYMLSRAKCNDALQCTLKPLLQKLEKSGVTKLPGESLNHYFSRVEEEEDIPLSTVNRLYHQLRYQKTVQKETLIHLKEEIEHLKNRLK